MSRLLDALASPLVGIECLGECGRNLSCAESGAQELHGFTALFEISTGRKFLKHLRPSTRKWIEEVCALYHVPSANLRLLVLAGEALDMAETARELIAREGLVIVNAHGGHHANPAIAIARDAALRFARLVRHAGLLDVAPPAQTPSPSMASPRGKKRKQIE